MYTLFTRLRPHANKMPGGYHAHLPERGTSALRIDLLIQGGPLATSATNNALAFARAAVAAGHSVGRVFFYKDAVAIGNRFAEDKGGLRAAWLEFGGCHGAELVLCVSAAERRGVVERHTLAEGFLLRGLGVLVETMVESDRLVSF